MSHYDNTDRTAYITLGFLLGIAGGAIAGLLVAPRSGEESREQLMQKANQAKEKARQQVNIQKEVAADKLSKVLDKTAKTAEQAQTKVSSPKPPAA